MATRRRSAPRTSRTARRGRRQAGVHDAKVDEAVIRSLVGIVLLIVGVVTLIGLALPEPGQADRLVARLDRAVVRERPGPVPVHPAGLRRLARVAAARDRLAAADRRRVRGLRVPARDRRSPGRRPGSSRARAAAGSGLFLADVLPGLITAARCARRPAARRDRGAGPRARPAAAGLVRGSAVGRQGGRCRAPRRSADVGRGLGFRDGRQGRLPRPRPRRAPRTARRGALKAIPVGPSPGQTEAWGDPRASAIPAAIPSPRPTSSTFAPARWPAARARPGRRLGDARPAPPGPRPRRRHRRAQTRHRPRSASPTSSRRSRRSTTSPSRSRPASTRTPTQRNEEIIVKKLAGFGIPAKIVGRNAGPVVTQYEVQPAPDIKVSRIEGLSDDLAMALAARSLRIEAPIPGKSAVGIEVPNKDFNIVALRRILEEVDFRRRAPR